jgi:acyl-coenzyme A synthetase/AMP-(fatty) acid ligase
MDSEDPLYILYTCGSPAKPKGIVHTTGGYLTGVAYTHHAGWLPTVIAFVLSTRQVASNRPRRHPGRA